MCFYVAFKLFLRLRKNFPQTRLIAQCTPLVHFAVEVFSNGNIYRYEFEDYPRNVHKNRFVQMLSDLRVRKGMLVCRSFTCNAKYRQGICYGK